MVSMGGLQMGRRRLAMASTEIREKDTLRTVSIRFTGTFILLFIGLSSSQILSVLKDRTLMWLTSLSLILYGMRMSFPLSLIQKPFSLEIRLPKLRVRQIAPLRVQGFPWIFSFGVEDVREVILPLYRQ